MAHQAALDSTPHTDPKQPLLARWERSSDPSFVAYLTWETTLSGEQKGKAYSVPHTVRLPYSQTALQRRYEYGRDVPKWWKPQTPPQPAPAQEKEVRIDIEIARIQLGLCMDEGGRIWAVLREMVRASHSGGWIDKKSLLPRLAKWGIHYTPQHLRRILRSYEGLYWNRSQRKIFVRGPLIKHFMEKIAR